MRTAISPSTFAVTGVVNQVFYSLLMPSLTCRMADSTAMDNEYNYMEEAGGSFGCTYTSWQLYLRGTDADRRWLITPLVYIPHQQCVIASLCMSRTALTPQITPPSSSLALIYMSSACIHDCKRDL